MERCSGDAPLLPEHIQSPHHAWKPTPPSWVRPPPDLLTSVAPQTCWLSFLTFSHPEVPPNCSSSRTLLPPPPSSRRSNLQTNCAASGSSFSQLPGKPFLEPRHLDLRHMELGSWVQPRAPRHMCLNVQRADVSRRRWDQREGSGETEGTSL